MKLSSILILPLVFASAGAKLRGRTLDLPLPSSIVNIEAVAPSSPTLDAIRKRDVLRCGISPGAAGFSKQNEDGTWEGFDVALCQAVAAVILGDAAKVEYVPMSSAVRFRYLADDVVDMLARTTTHTIGRDVNEPTTGGKGFTFTTPYFYTGLGMGGVPAYSLCANNLDTEDACAGLKICAPTGTTSLEVVRELFEETPDVVVEKPASTELEPGLVDGTCNVIATDQTSVVPFAITQNRVYTGEYEAGTKIFSKDPLAMVSREDDPVFSDVLMWVLQGLIAMEEQGITQAISNDAPQHDSFAAYGVDADWLKRAIAVGGNYGELYEKHLEPVIAREGSMNDLNDISCPQQYALF